MITYTLTHTQAYTHRHTHTHTHIHRYIHTYSHIYTGIHTQKHIQILTTRQLIIHQYTMIKNLIRYRFIIIIHTHTNLYGQILTNIPITININILT